MNKNFATYIMASEKNGKLYVGVTSNLKKRAYEHREGMVEGYTKKNKIKKLVFFQPHDSGEQAIRSEKEMKMMRRQEKIDLIAKMNPEWLDLYDQL